MGYCDVCQSAGSVNRFGFCEVCGSKHKTTGADLVLETVAVTDFRGSYDALDAG